MWWIRRAILQTLMEKSTVRVPVNRLDMQSKVSRAYEALQQDGSEPILEKKVEQTIVDN